MDRQTASRPPAESETIWDANVRFGDVSPAPSTTFVIVDDQPVVSLAIQKLVASQPHWRVLCRLRSVLESRPTCSREQPHVVFLGVVRPSDIEFAFLGWLRTNLPNTASVVHSAQPEAIYAQRCIRAGASAYVGKEASIDTLLHTITLAIHGATVVNGAVIDHATTSFVRSGCVEGVASLSERELEVLHMLGEGMSTQKIAAVMCRSARTIDSHRYRIAQKLKISGGSELVHFAIRHQIASQALAAVAVA